ncbi:hypothetical protein WG915_11040 [Corynebacterium sp. H128]|uniref:hypothetical protein n=1 Tax=unclassified Corynebacterium TaxID=2624378 RepID=UPI0030A3B665
MNYAIKGAERKVARSQACRIISGGGDMSLTAYQINAGEQLDVVAHGLDDQGRLTFVCRAEDALLYEDMAVRVDAVLKAPEFRADIISASLHGLGVVEWQEFHGQFRSGIIQVEQVFVHNFAQPIPFQFGEIVGDAMHLPEVVVDEFAAREAVGELSKQQCNTLIDAVVAETYPGGAVTMSGFGGCEHHADEVYVVDICEHGITLMQTANGRMATALVPFAKAAYTIEDLARRVVVLAAEASARHASSRI